MTAVERRATRTFESVESRRTPYWVVVEQYTVQVGLFESSERRELVAVVLAESEVGASLLGMSQFTTSLAQVDEIQEELLYGSEREAELVAVILA